VLVGLFLVAQFAGVVSSPRASAAPMAAPLVSSGHDHHAQDPQAKDPQAKDPQAKDHGQAPGDQGMRHGHHDHANHADVCCGLHACFSGVLPQAVAAEIRGLTGELLSVGPDDLVLGIPSGRLDRPPRPLH
jgi:hypothetical protein